VQALIAPILTEIFAIDHDQSAIPREILDNARNPE
jgi:hypothetical protein